MMGTNAILSRGSVRKQAAAWSLLVLAYSVLAIGWASPAQATTFTPVADSYIDASRPSSTFGALASMRVDRSPVRTAYLRFDASNIAGTDSAEVRIHAESASPVGVELRTVDDVSWSESAINYSNAPPVGPVIATTGTVTSGTWYTFDVSASFAADSDGIVSFALTVPGNTAVRFTSREGVNAPELLVPKGPKATHFLVTADGDRYRAESATTGVAYTGTVKFVVERAVADLRAAGGGTVEFAEGVFDLGTAYLELHDVHNIAFKGQGIDLTVLENDTSAQADTEPFNFSGAFSVAIRDMTIAARGAPRSTSDAIDLDNGNDTVIERVKIVASRGRGIVFDGKNAGWNSLNNVVRDCMILGVPGNGIELLASSNNRIENCTIADVGRHGIQIAKSSTVADQPNKKSTDNILSGNVIRNSGLDGINLNSVDRNLVSGNTVTDSSNNIAGRDGIRISSSDLITCDDNRVEGNVATDDQATKTQRYGLNISSTRCNRTVVASTNDFSGNLAGAIRDLGTGTQYV